MKELKEVYGNLIRNYGKDFADDAMVDLLAHEVNSGKMKFEQAEKILQVLKDQEEPYGGFQA